MAAGPTTTAFWPGPPRCTAPRDGWLRTAGVPAQAEQSASETISNGIGIVFMVSPPTPPQRQRREGLSQARCQIHLTLKVPENGLASRSPSDTAGQSVR